MIVSIKFGASFVLCVTKAWPSHKFVQLAHMLVHLLHFAKIKFCCVLPHSLSDVSWMSTLFEFLMLNKIMFSFLPSNR